MIGAHAIYTLATHIPAARWVKAANERQETPQKEGWNSRVDTRFRVLQKELAPAQGRQNKTRHLERWTELIAFFMQAR